MPVPSNPSKAKAPQAVFSDSHTIFAFPPNRETLGGTAYFILEVDGNAQPCNILVDCPAFNDVNQAFLTAKGGVHTLFITHRGGMAQVPDFQKAFDCQVLIQEQEAYLLPTVHTTTFHREKQLSDTSRVFWNPGHSPGSASLYHSAQGGILFSGRHLLPTKDGSPAPLRLSKTFHWPRQLRYAQRLTTDFSADTLSYICPGASTGFLRGEKKIDEAYRRLQALDWEVLKTATPKM
ncbi:MAG: MBL fold metallo-hydrolase [Phormidesmis sp.]